MAASCIDQAVIHAEHPEREALLDDSHSAPSQPSVEEQALRSINRLLKQHAASRVIQWQTINDGSLVPIGKSPAAPEQLVRKFKLLAEQAVASGRVQSRIQRGEAAGQLQQWVAAPMVGIPGGALSVMFPHTSENVSESSLALRCSDVEVAAAHLAILAASAEQAERKSERPAPNPEVAPKPAYADKQDLASGPQIQSWKQIRGAVWAQCKSAAVIPSSRLKLGCLAFAAVVLVGLIPFPHRVSCQVTCEPATRRFVAAPFDAKLLSCNVDVGQSVSQDEVLALLDGSDLRSQIAGAQAKLSQASQRRSAALAHRDASNSEFERLEIQQLQRELEVLEHRQTSLEIRSPITGVVVNGDLRRSEGATFAVGEPLFEIAPLEGMIAEIAIAEEDISYVESGMPTSIHLEAIPSKWFQTKIERIHTRNELRDNASVFIAEAAIDNASAQLRPGMSGASRVTTGYRPLGWILFHKPYEAVRQLVGW